MTRSGGISPNPGATRPHSHKLGQLPMIQWIIVIPERVTELLELCLGSTYFGFKGECYGQVSEAAMGPPVSAVVANIYMEFFEELAISTSNI